MRWLWYLSYQQSFLAHSRVLEPKVRWEETNTHLIKNMGPSDPRKHVVKDLLNLALGTLPWKQMALKDHNLMDLVMEGAALELNESHSLHAFLEAIPDEIQCEVG